MHILYLHIHYLPHSSTTHPPSHSSMPMHSSFTLHLHIPHSHHSWPAQPLFTPQHPSVYHPSSPCLVVFPPPSSTSTSSPQHIRQTVLTRANSKNQVENVAEETEAAVAQAIATDKTPEVRRKSLCVYAFVCICMCVYKKVTCRVLGYDVGGWRVLAVLCGLMILFHPHLLICLSPLHEDNTENPRRWQWMV